MQRVVAGSSRFFASFRLFCGGDRRFFCEQVCVRFAPSPTGELHLGGLRTALFNYLFAKRNNGKFLIRIEDTDQSRTVEGCQERIIEDCKWMGIEAEEEIFKQSENLENYKKYADKLIEEGNAYKCFCTPQRLEELRALSKSKGKSSMYDRKCLHLTEEQIASNIDSGMKYTIRMKVPRNEHLIVKDIVYDTIKFDCGIVDDQIIFKSDGFPTYHLASVVDDHFQGISHVIRGEEWMSSMPKHMLLYRFLAWKPPRFAHLPLLLNPDKSKLSKRQESSSLKWYRAQGFEREAILSYIAALGWTPNHGDGDGSRYLSMEELISQFSLKEVSKSGAVVDIMKLYSINSEFLNHLSIQRLDELVDYVVPILDDFLGFRVLERFNREYVSNVISLITSRMKIIQEFTRIAYFFTDPDYKSETGIAMKQKVWKERSAIWIAKLKERIEEIPENEFSVISITEKLKEICTEEKVKMGNVYPTYRYALTGTFVGAGVPETIHVFGKHRTLLRLAHVYEQHGPTNE